jgi:hypothetical protein
VLSLRLARDPASSVPEAAVSKRLRSAANLAAECGCPAARYPERREALMALNAERESASPSGTSDTVERVQRALEDVLRARIRRARRAA